MKHLSKRALAVVGLGAVIAAGAVTASATTSGTGTSSNYTAVQPTRVLDTRVAPATAVAALGTVSVALPTTAVPAGSTAVTVNVTVTAPKAAGYLIVDPDGTASPKGTSNLNFTAGQTAANEATVPLGADGKIQVTNESPGTVQLIVDVEGYYTATAPAYTPPTVITQSAAQTNGVVGTANTGGSAVSGATDELDVALPAGTYQVAVDAKATPNADTAADVDPQFFVYDQALTSSFTGNLFNVGSGALQSGTSHDAYFTGSGLVTVPSGGETLHVYAFGYDGDSGASTYTLDSLTLTAVPVAVATS